MLLKNRHKVQIIFVFSKKNPQKIKIAHNIYVSSSLCGIFSITLQTCFMAGEIRIARALFFKMIKEFCETS